MLLQLIDYSNKISNDTIFETTQLLFTLSLKEIIRQVSVNCQERGYLIHRIWSS